jgi:hypothetical protein
MYMSSRIRQVLFSPAFENLVPFLNKSTEAYFSFKPFVMTLTLTYYQVDYIIITSGVSPRPANWILERLKMLQIYPLLKIVIDDML